MYNDPRAAHTVGTRELMKIKMERNDPHKIKIGKIRDYLIVPKARLGKTATKTSWDFRIGLDGLNFI